jgi:hypothetical protein
MLISNGDIATTMTLMTHRTISTVMYARVIRVKCGDPSYPSCTLSKLRFLDTENSVAVNSIAKT